MRYGLEKRPKDLVDATVKFFDRAKGYGFVTLPDGSEAFLHATTLEAKKLAFPNEGDVIVGRLEDGPRGVHLADIQELKPAPLSPSVPRPAGRRGPRKEGTPALGTMKWFDHGKGFGFVAVDDGGPDAILHRNVLDRHRLPIPAEEQRLLLLLVDRPRGREAVVAAIVETPQREEKKLREKPAHSYRAEDARRGARRGGEEPLRRPRRRETTE
jgi:CspA family cold shock protein